MKFNIGIDIEQVSRFRNRNNSLLKKFLLENELKNIKRYKSYNAQHLAGIFCAKEAVIKACGQIKKLNFQNIEILHNKDGSPYVVFKNCKNLSSENIKVSISHSKDYAVAIAILLMNKNDE